MSAATFPSFSLIICLLVCSSGALTNITAGLGEDAILPCKVPNNNNITVVEWIRPGLDPDHVLFYRDEHLDPDNQHPSYQNRVDLQDKDMKDGDVSLILKNVTMEDTGTYVCQVLQKGTNRKKRSILKTEPISIINLEVHPSGEKSEGAMGGVIRDKGNKIGGDQGGISRGHPGVVGAILLLAVISVDFWIYIRCSRQNPNLPVPPDVAAAIQILTVPEQHQNQVQLV